MSGISDYVENETLDHWLSGLAAPSPANVYLALFTTAPGDDASGTEVSGGSYARIIAAFGVAAAGIASNSGLLQFAVSTGAWGDVTHIGIFDALTTGNLLFWGVLAETRTVASGEAPKFQIGDIAISLD